MAKQVKWDEYEAALLLDACVRVEQGTLAKKDAIRSVSQALRQRARDRGLEIDEAYRNENGISWQFERVDALLRHKPKAEEHNSKLFIRIVNIYYEDCSHYNEILAIAKGEIVNKKTKQELFSEWLAGRVSQHMLSEYFIAATELETYAKKKDIISGSIWDVDSSENAKKIESKLAADRAFLYLHKKSARSMREMARLFLEYTREKEKGKNISETINTHKERIKFQKWLMDSGISEHNSKRMVNCVAHAGAFLNKESNSADSIFLMENVSRLTEIYKELAENSAFKKFAGAAFPFVLYALKKYISFCTANKSPIAKETATDAGQSVTVDKADTDIKRLAEILKASFPDGFRPGSVIDRNRLRLYYADSFGEELKKSDEEINVTLGRIGSLQDGRIYVRDAEAQSRLIDTIFAEIDSVMKNGAAGVYYSELYERYRQELAEQLKIYSADVMTEQLKKAAKGKYRFGSRCIFIIGRAINPERDVQRVLINSQQPLSFAELHEMLWYMPMDLIKTAVRMSPGVVNVAANTYFYAPNIPISREELQTVAQLIRNELAGKPFLKDTELRKLIKENLPSVAINTADFTDRGFRNCLAALLGNQFDFKGTVIGPKGETGDTSHMFAEFCKSHDSMSLDELKAFSIEIKAPINWSRVMKCMLRVSENEFVRKGSISFDAEATDRVLSEFFEGEYMPLKDFKLFLHYPPIGIKWNKYVLESYVYGYSRKFKLLHTSFSESDCCGAVVRQGSSIKDMRGLVLDVLSHSDEWNTAGEAISLLVSKGYIQRRSFSGIDEIVHVAGLQRKRMKENSER